jgi:hypothetical protein
MGKVNEQGRYVPVASGLPALSKDLKRNLAKAHRLLADHGLSAVPHVVHGQHAMRHYHPHIAYLHESRNIDAGRPTHLPRFQETFDNAGFLALLRVDDYIAAWNLVRPDADVWRVLAGQMAAGFEQYRPGRLLEVWLLEQAVKDPAVRWLDWGEGHPEALLKLAR